jgi:uncharacterized protein YbjT (DUF2867 family)
MSAPLEILVTGGTGYMGRHLLSRLAARGHHVRALARPSSARRVPTCAKVVQGDALDATSVAHAMQRGDSVIHLVGTPHPNPRKAAEFEQVDLVSIRATVSAAARVGISHLVYVSVAHPAPIMHAYIAARAAGEAAIDSAGLRATVLRPWYVVGPGHWWPVLLTPMYSLAGLWPPTRAGAERLGLVSLNQMIRALVYAVENPPLSGVRVVEVPAIRRARIA